jgi:hypothetical protein
MKMVITKELSPFKQWLLRFKSWNNWYFYENTTNIPLHLRLECGSDCRCKGLDNAPGWEGWNRKTVYLTEDKYVYHVQLSFWDKLFPKL